MVKYYIVHMIHIYITELQRPRGGVEEVQDRCVGFCNSSMLLVVKIHHISGKGCA